MKITIINGSPKGNNSVTLHTALYIQKKFPEHEFTLVNAAAKIRQYEKEFSEAADKLKEADIIIFIYPVYTFLVPSQLHRFVELMKESGIDFSGKTASQITTSKHFYDVTAHGFINDNCTDMGMNIVGGLSADMEDLLKPEGRKQAEDFMKFLVWSVENGIFEDAAGRKINECPKGGNEASQETAAGIPVADFTDESKPGNVVIVADLKESDHKLRKMIKDFTDRFPRKCRVINIREFDFKGGCLGCMSCVGSGKCIYNDGFEDLLRNEIQKSESIIYAFTIRDHSMGSRFKMYDDRQFCNGHRTVIMGMPVGYIINGNLDCEPNLRLTLKSRGEVGGNFVAGFGTDEKKLDELSKKLVFALDNKYAPPSNFYGVGGSKIFRDLIYQMRGLLRADHKFFKSHGQYDFPHKNKGKTAAMYLVGILFNNEKLKKKMGSRLDDGMTAPYKKVVDRK
ncbi:MAG: NAD(P)H-dependent oxidoreductase [Parasporobacterium sp.]|nr:NAD(P)H-dependent oxidoreductase [Parasporobacterium sp.]